MHKIHLSHRSGGVPFPLRPCITQLQRFSEATHATAVCSQVINQERMDLNKKKTPQNLKVSQIVSADIIYIHVLQWRFCGRKEGVGGNLIKNYDITKLVNN